MEKDINQTGLKAFQERRIRIRERCNKGVTVPAPYKLLPKEDEEEPEEEEAEAAEEIKEEATAGEDEEEKQGAEPAQQTERPEDLSKAKESARAAGGLSPVRVIEAALFIANRPVSLNELAEVANASKQKTARLIDELKQEYAARGNAFEVVVNEGEETAVIQVRPQYLGLVSGLSKKIDLSRKATRILALVAKKKQLLQKDLKHYFRGEIYAYVTELKEKGYIEAEKRGNTRLLKPTKNFLENFQLSE